MKNGGLILVSAIGLVAFSIALGALLAISWVPYTAPPHIDSTVQPEPVSAFRSAVASEIQASAARWQLVLSAIGVGGLAATLWFNFAAWRQARSSEKQTDRALEAAEESARAAHRQADIAEEIAQRQLRAYVSMLPIKITPLTSIYRPIKITIAHQNTGQTPAVKVRLRSNWRLDINDAPDAAFMLRDGGRSSLAVIGAGQEREWDIPLHDLSNASVAAILSGTHILYFFGQFDYEDVFGNVRHTSFRYRYDPHRYPALMFTCESGNDIS